jgi:uncharacterized membrane protein YidH (DUF202 family)
MSTNPPPLVFLVIGLTLALSYIAILAYAVNHFDKSSESIDLWFKLSGAVFFTLYVIAGCLTVTLVIFRGI